MEAAFSSETYVSYIITQHHNPEELDLNLHRRENLKPRNISLLTKESFRIFYQTDYPSNH
jgi:hypothetical protein